MKKLLQLGNVLFFTMSILWLYFAFHYAFEFLSIDLVGITTKPALLLVVLTALIFLLYAFRDWCFQAIKGTYTFLVSHKRVTVLLLTVVQGFILLTSLGLARADTTILYQIVTDAAFAKETIYISQYPNNFLFLLYLKAVHWLSPDRFILHLSILNILFINASLFLSYFLLKKYFAKRITDIYFMLYVFLFALQPQFIYTYTDPITLFFVVCMSAALAYLIKYWQQPKGFVLWSLILGLLVSVCYHLRPPTVIYIIALFAVLVSVQLKKSFTVTKIVASILLAFATFGIIKLTLNTLLEKQDFVFYEDNHSRSLIYYIDLGLTYGGNYHHEIPQEIVEATAETIDELALKDIQRRLNEYNTATFIGHLYYKYYWITGEGMFGWNQERVMSEENALSVSFVNKHFAKTVRSIVYATGENFRVQGIFFQVIWLVTILGVIVYSYQFKQTSTPIALWLQITLFGGFLFLMIFEGGRTRYLIQFLPSILLLSSIGWDRIVHTMQRIKTLTIE